MSDYNHHDGEDKTLDELRAELERISIAIAQGIVRWLQRPENRTIKNWVKGFQATDDARFMRRYLWDKMDAESWLKMPDTKDAHYFFHDAVTYAWRYLKIGRYTQ